MRNESNPPSGYFATRDDAPTPTASIPAAGSSTTAPRVAALDGLRGIAVLLVVVMHYYSVVPTPADAAVHDFLRRACSLFFCGVDLFFVLSGYFIGGILLDHRGSPRLLPAFYLRRFLRIVPIYLLLLGCVAIGRNSEGLRAIYHGAFFASGIPDWTYLTFTQNIAMAWKHEMGPHWLSVTWSLAIEEQFYLVLPLVVMWLNRRHLATACVAMIALTPVLRVAALQFSNPFAAVFLLPMRADGLLCGVLCAVIVRHERAVAVVDTNRKLIALAAAAFTLAIPLFSPGGLGAGSWPVASVGYTILAAYFSAIVLLVVTQPNSWLALALSARPLTVIGVTSYFIYLFHRPIWYVLHWLLFQTAPMHFTWKGGIVTCLSFVVTLLAAAISWFCLEAPLLRLGRRFPYR